MEKRLHQFHLSNILALLIPKNKKIKIHKFTFFSYTQFFSPSKQNPKKGSMTNLNRPCQFQLSLSHPNFHFLFSNNQTKLDKNHLTLLLQLKITKVTNYTLFLPFCFNFFSNEQTLKQTSQLIQIIVLISNELM